MLVSEAIGVDYQYLDEWYENLKSAPTTDDKIKWRNMLVWNTARHAISEELTPPKLTSALTLQVKEDLYTLQSLSPSDQNFAPLLEHLMHDLHTHIEHEKTEGMPHLEAKLFREESETMMESFPDEETKSAEVD
ncbi:putative hemerythrin-like protein [Lachnellula hyalina]|uniref:Putative hemerythrin-like protein n=1 Tax=Lachnellula hyalina TaxID=1316788 RepID=A0A8H8TZ29_9HELO|nr:putative hemerythrin-like protein [Lachnellula hyalina]TVY25447.1 putative hemerythrin-like protein [Lachnellula hyalina]